MIQCKTPVLHLIELIVLLRKVPALPLDGIDPNVSEHDTESSILLNSTSLCPSDAIWAL